MNALLTTRPSRRRIRVTAVVASLALTLLSVGTGAGISMAATNAETANPNLNASCGLDIALVLDGSGSIGTANATQAVKDAANAFLASLANTDTRAGVVTFSTAIKDHAKVLGLQPVTTATLSSTFTPEINQYASGGFTNWQVALQAANSSILSAADNGTSGNRAGVPDLVVFITDGAPNTTNTSSDGQYADGSDNAVNPAITAANTLKAGGAHILTVGVGQALSGSNTNFRTALGRVSGYDAYDPNNVLTGPELGSPPKFTKAAFDPKTTDVILESNFNNLKDQLVSVATSLCSGSLTIKKLASTPEDPNNYQPASGWTFNATPTADAASYKWVKPSAGAGGGSKNSDATGPDGLTGFQWDASAPTTWNNSKTVNILENLTVGQTSLGFKMVDVSCTKKTANGDVAVSPSNLNLANRTFGIAVGATDIVNCVVKNQPASKVDVELTKTIQGAAPYSLGTNRVFDVKVRNVGAVPATNVVVKDLLPAGLTYVSHTATQGTYVSGTGVWTVGTLPVSTSYQTLSITATLAQTGSVTNLAEVTGTTEPDSDSTPNNCQAGNNKEDDCATVTIDVTRDYTLGLDKVAVTPGPLTIGQKATFDIVVTNNGPSPAAAGAIVTDQLNVNLLGATVDSSPGFSPCAISGGNLLTCTTTSQLASGASLTIRVSGFIGAGYNNAAEVSNQACVKKNVNDTAPVCDTTTIPLIPDLTIEKVANDPTTVGTGAAISWKFRVTNLGAAAKTVPFTVTDTLPAGITSVSYTPGAGWACNNATNTCTYTPSGGGLAAGASTSYVTVNATVTANPAEGSEVPLVNKACVVDNFNEQDNTPGDQNDGNDCAQATITVKPRVDLTILKGASPGTVQVGGDITYSFVVTNNGPSATSNIQFTDTLAPGLVPGAVTAGANWNCNVVSTTLTCTWAGGLVNAGANTSASPVTWVATVGASLADSTSVPNTACVKDSYNEPDATPNNANDGNDCSSTTTNITPKVDLGLVKVADPSSVQVNGGPATWKVTVTNYGPSKAGPAITVTDELPAGLLNTTVSGTNWTCPASPIANSDVTTSFTCTYNNGSKLNVGASTSVLTISGTPNATYNDGGSLENSACTSDDIVGDEHAPLLDVKALAVPATHYDCDEDTVTVTPVVDLEMVKIAEPSGDEPVGVGGQITFTFHVVNNGPSKTSDITFTDEIPAGLEIGALTDPADNWDCSFSGPTNHTLTCDWTGGDVLVGNQTSDVKLVTTVGDELADNTEVSNTACVQDDFDEVAADIAPNDCDTTTTEITPVFVIVVQKSQVEANPVAPGSTIHYNLKLTNQGPSSATGFTVTDVVPAPLTVTGATGTDMDCSATVGNNVSCTYNGAVKLAKNASRTVQVTATVGEDAANHEGVVNTAKVGECVPGDEVEIRALAVVEGGPVGETGPCSSVTTEFPQGDLTLVKTNNPVEATPVQVGGTITYTLEAHATGTLDQKGVVVTDILPGFDPSTPTSGTTTYVADSAECVGGPADCATYNPATHTISWAVGNVPAGTSKFVTFQVVVPVQGTPGASFDVYNQGHATSTYTDDVPSNTVKNVVDTAASVEIDKLVARAPNFQAADDFFDSVGYARGETAVYRFHVVNTGKVDVSNLKLGDNLNFGPDKDTSLLSSPNEDDLTNCRVGNSATPLDGSSGSFSIGSVIPGVTLSPGEGVYLYCDLVVPTSLTDAQIKLNAIFNISDITGTTVVGDVDNDSNVTILTVLPKRFDAFPLKNIVDNDGTNPRKFDNMETLTAPTVKTFRMTIDNTSEKTLDFTLYDYFDNASLGLTDAQREAIFNGMKCVDYDNPADYDSFPNSFPNPIPAPEFFENGPEDTTFGANSVGEGAGTFYARSHDLGPIGPGDGYEVACSATLPAGQYDLTNVFRMVANEVDVQVPSAKKVQSAARGAAVLPNSAVAVVGEIDLTAEAGVEVGTPTGTVPEEEPAEPTTETEVLGEQLVKTGAAVIPTLLAGMLLVGMGVMITTATRRRRNGESIG